MSARNMFTLFLPVAMALGQSGGDTAFDPELARYLDLAPSQVAAIADSSRVFNATLERYLAEVNRLEREIAAELERPRPDPVRTGEFELQLENVRRQSAADRSIAVRRNRDVLTEPQRERLSVLSRAAGMLMLESDTSCAGLIPVVREEAENFASCVQWTSGEFPLSATLRFHLGLSAAQVARLLDIGREHVPRLRLRGGAIQDIERRTQVERLAPNLNPLTLATLRLRAEEERRAIALESTEFLHRRISVLDAAQARTLAALQAQLKLARTALSAQWCHGLLEARTGPIQERYIALYSSNSLQPLFCATIARSPGFRGVLAAVPDSVLLPYR